MVASYQGLAFQVNKLSASEFFKAPKEAVTFYSTYNAFVTLSQVKYHCYLIMYYARYPSFTIPPV